ncbi:MAG TPA: PspA/IM30 family protein [Candidatus Melainabacteria bacterium]|nr:PspA/IM30 family protein [Candidatus Melainabacteria bacterium]
MFQRIATLFKAMVNNILGKMEDPQMLLEQTYQDLQQNLIQVRQAVAQAIATEKQIEQQLQKNKDQAATWQNRAAMAVQQGNDDLARQALQRKQQYSQAATDFETQLKAQKEVTTSLRQRLTELENEVQKYNTKKQVLIARDKAAQATSKANEILSKTSTSGALSIMDRMEEKVGEKEARAAALAELGTDTLEDKFKDFEGDASIEMELLALKGGGVPPGGDHNLLTQDKPGVPEGELLLEIKEDAEEAQEVKD